jgi:hypothetical protein
MTRAGGASVRSETFATKRAAQAALSEALAGLQQGTYLAPSKQTVREFLGTWIETVKPELAITARLVLDGIGSISLPLL